MHFLYYTLTLISSWIYLIYIFYFYFSCKKKLTRNPSKKTRQTFTKNTRKNNFAELSSIAVLRYGRKWKPSRSANKKIHTYTDNRNAEKKLKSSGQISTKQSKKIILYTKLYSNKRQWWWWWRRRQRLWRRLRQKRQTKDNNDEDYERQRRRLRCQQTVKKYKNWIKFLSHFTVKQQQQQQQHQQKQH